MLIKNTALLFTIILINCITIHQNGNAQRCNMVDQNPDDGKIDYTKTNLAQRSAYSFQLVFHVMYTNEEENIGLSQIYSQMEILNEIYDHEVIPNDLNIPAEFRNLKANPNIHFCLADKDPNGQSTSGVTRTKITDINIACKKFVDDKRYIMHSTLGGLDIWNPNQYINVYIVNRDQCNALGETIFPWDATSEDDGIIIDYRALGFIGNATNNIPFHQGKTLVHEMGHFFGLKHLSGDHPNDCQGDDLVTDTPTQKGEYSGCPSFPQNSCGMDNMFMNYMSFVNDPCMQLFTKGQVERMQLIIQQYKSELIKSTCAEKRDTAIDRLTTIYNQGSWQIKNLDNLPWSGNLEFFDETGRLIWTGNAKQSISLSIPAVGMNLQAGIYFLRITQGSDTKTFNLIKLP